MRESTRVDLDLDLLQYAVVTIERPMTAALTTGPSEVMKL